MRSFLFTFLIFRCLNTVVAQAFDTELPAQACLNQTILLKNNLLPDAVDVTWDFCEGDLHRTDLTISVRNSTIGLPIGVDIIKTGTRWYGFICDRGNNKLFRLDFGDDLTNTNPAIIDLGNLGGMLDQPQGIKMVEFQNNFYGFVNNLSTSTLVRINFGTSVEATTATADVLAAGGGFGNGGMDVAFDDVSWVVAQTRNDRLELYNLGNSPANGVQSTLSTSAITGASNVGDVNLVRENNQWYAFVCAYGSNSFHRLHFGSAIFSNPTSAQLSVSLSYSPFGLQVEKDNGEWMLFATTISGNLVRLTIGENIENNSPAYSDLGTFDKLLNTLKVALVRYRSRWIGLTTRYDNKDYFLIEFPESICAFNKVYSGNVDTVSIKPLQSGRFFSTMSARNVDGVQVSSSKEVNVLSTIVPDVQISNTVCSSVPTQFQISPSADLTQVSWDFDNDWMTDATTFEPSHDFQSVGTVDIAVEILAKNGCKNFLKKSIELYSPPVASYSIPSGILCTNNQLTFQSTTVDNFGGNLTYQWFVDNVMVGSVANLEFTFETTSAKTLKLITSIPGCANEITQTISSIQPGPIVDFSAVGSCEDTQINFISSVVGSVSSRSWNFGDGAISTEQDPVHIFSNPQLYLVTHATTSPNGCNNSKSKSITIYTNPSPDFAIDAPPLSCSGSSTPFQDLTPDPLDSDIQSWQWNFGDPGSDNLSSVKNPQHIFLRAGNYTVSLVATTDAGCSGSTQEQITINESPAVTINNSSTCLGLPTNFTTVGNGIATYYWEIASAYYDNANPTHTFNTVGNHNIRLTIMGNNDCLTVYDRIITVPATLSPDFSVTQNCAGFNALFTDITTGADPVVQRSWDFAGQGTGTGASSSFQFASTGNKNVKLTVTTQAGCSYNKTKAIPIVAAPVAGFTSSPESGAAPLDVTFTNTSTGASTYTWTFGDGTATSDQQSATHTFNELGEFEVDLVAANLEGCSSTLSKIISVVAPLPDVDLKLITISENLDGTLKVIITLHNKGNTILRNLPVIIDLSGNVSLTETITGPVAPFSMYNLVLSYGVQQSASVNFVCAEATLQSDLTPEGNRICKEFEGAVFFLSAYPNPANEEVAIEWLAPKDKVVTIQLFDSFGKTVASSTVTSLEGLNSAKLEVSKLRSGIYILQTRSGAVQKNQRIFVSGQN